MIQCIGRVLKMWNEFIYTKETTYSSKISRLGYGNDELKWTVKVPSNTIVCETLQKKELGEIIKKTKLWYPETTFIRISQIERYDYLNEKVNSPWLWIGCEDRNYTEELKQYLVKGNNITLFLLNQLFPKETNWEYISLSLEKLEFPVEGIQIK